MASVFMIPLQGRIGGEAYIEILRAEMLAGIHSSLALIRYADQGQEPEYGLRLDIDKRVFLDHLNDQRKELMLTKAAPQIAAIIGRELRAIRAGMDSQQGEQIARPTTTTGNTTVTTGTTVGNLARDMAAGTTNTIAHVEGSIPGIQTGGHAIDGSGAPDTRGITEKIADTITGNRIDDKTGRRV